MNEKIAGAVNYGVKAISLVCLTGIALFIFVDSLFLTVLTHDLDVLFYKDNPFIHIAAIAVVFGILLACRRLYRKTVSVSLKNKLSGMRTGVFIVLTVLVGIVLILLVCFGKVQPWSDQEICFNCANAFINGNRSSWREDYMMVYPFQNGLVMFDILLILLFGENAYLAFQCINVLFYIAAVAALYRICRLTFREKMSAFIYPLLLLFFPFALYVVYCYGTIIGFSFAMIAYMLMLDFMEKGRMRYAVLCGIAMTLSLLMKSNYAIVMVGIVLYLLFDFLTKRKIKNLAGIFVILAIYAVTANCFTLAVRQATGEPQGDPIPKVAWVAMGLRDEVNAPGWFDGYNGYIHKRNGYDAAATSKVCLYYIKLRCQYFLHNQKPFVKFFYLKLSSEWVDPLSESSGLLAGATGEGLQPFAQQLRETDGLPAFKQFLNILQSVLNCGLVLYCITCWRNFRTLQVTELALAVLMIGGFIFFTFWEAKSSYTLPYYYVALPYAVVGWKKLLEWVENRWGTQRQSILN